MHAAARNAVGNIGKMNDRQIAEILSAPAVQEPITLYDNVPQWYLGKGVIEISEHFALFLRRP